jgi:type I restriction enzyme S subunit
MSLTGTSGKEDYGFVVEVPSVPSTLLLNQRVVKLTPTSPKLLKEFLLFFLLSRKFLDHLYPTAKGMKQANLSTNSMKKLLLVIPDVVEQRQIATCFRTLDSKLDVHRRKHAALRALFRTLLHELMTARVRVPADITLPQEGS